LLHSHEINWSQIFAGNHWTEDSKKKLRVKVSGVFSRRLEIAGYKLFTAADLPAKKR